MNANPHILDPEQLRELCRQALRRTRAPSDARVRQWAHSAGIKVGGNAGAAWTTVEAVNRALGVGSANDPQYRPDDIA